MARNPANTGYAYQETVYFIKRQQAQTFKDAGYDESRIREFPYVEQYADFRKLSYKAAADDILLAAKVMQEVLLNTEALRLKYFKKMKEITSLDEFDAFWKEYESEAYAHALT
jgi:hypothetical protein